MNTGHGMSMDVCRVVMSMAFVWQVVNTWHEHDHGTCHVHDLGTPKRSLWKWSLLWVPFLETVWQCLNDMDMPCT